VSVPRTPHATIAWPPLLAAAVAWAGARAQSKAAPLTDPNQTTAALCGAARALLADLDAAFGRGDEPAFFACFADDAHCRPRSAWRLRWVLLHQREDPLQRHTQVAERLPAEGAVALVLDVDYASPHEPGTHSRVQELALLTPDEERPRLRLLVDYDRDLAHRLLDRDGVVRCPPCNFAFRSPPGWLAAPLAASGALCLDAVAFYHPVHDLCLELAVQATDPGDDARALLDSLARGLRVGAAAPAPDALPWHPRLDGGGPAPTLDGARLELDLDEDQRALLCAATHGGMAYLVAVHGSEAAFAAVPEAAAAPTGLVLLHGAPAEGGQRRLALAHHTGEGCLENDVYSNPGFGVVAPLPSGWQHELRGEQGFTVVSTSPDADGEMRLTAYTRPRGFAAWNTVLAARFALAAGQRWLGQATDSGWQSDAGAPPRRECTRLVDDREEGLLFVCSPQVLVVVQWSAGSGANREALATARNGLTVR